MTNIITTHCCKRVTEMMSLANTDEISRYILTFSTRFDIESDLVPVSNSSDLTDMLKTSQSTSRISIENVVLRLHCKFS